MDERLDPWRPPKHLEQSPVVVETELLLSESSKLSWPTKVWLIVGGIVAPLVCHGLSTLGLSNRPQWQTGSLSDKLAFILTPQAGFVLYPMLLYAMLCMGMYLYRVSRVGPPLWVRVGLWSGIPIALFYMIILAMSLNGKRVSASSLLILLTAQFGIPAIALLVAWLAAKFYRARHRRVYGRLEAEF